MHRIVANRTAIHLPRRILPRSSAVHTPRCRHLSTKKTTTFESFDGKTQEVPTTQPPTGKNLALATALVGFVGCVFMYSMNAVGKGDESSGEDPLAQLKAEAQEARDNNPHRRRLSPEEIEELESGLTGQYDKNSEIEVAVAAPAEIAQLEEEANMKVFQKKKGDQEPAKKKPWWRFGF